MFSPILVAFATQYGSTREVSEFIARALREEGHQVDVREMSTVTTLDPWRAVVLGAPFYLGHWHNDAALFLARFHTALVERPVAVFALGPVGTTRPDVEAGRQQLIHELALHPWLHPIAAEMFGGRYDPSHLDMLHRAVSVLPESPLRDLPPSDLRDWPAIAAWARGVARMLHPGTSLPTRSSA
jgi:menaquinone-dependent protoporphyrinogen oxidase